MKENLWIIGGGETFVSREKYLQWLESNTWLTENKKMWDWKKWIADGLFDTHCTLKIPMIDKTNADYEAWKIIFEKFSDNLDTNIPISLIGHSLGGIFLVKYLSENKFPCKIKSLHLVSAIWSYPNSTLHNTASFSFDEKNLQKIAPQCEKIHIWASEDDDIVNFEDSIKYHENIQGSHLHVFADRWHFLTSHFVELFQTFLQK